MPLHVMSVSQDFTPFTDEAIGKHGVMVLGVLVGAWVGGCLFSIEVPGTVLDFVG